MAHREGEKRLSAMSAIEHHRLVLVIVVTLLAFPACLCASCMARRMCSRWPADSGSAGQTKGAFVSFLVAAYFILNAWLSMLNRWALGLHGLNFPILMTATHMIFGASALSPYMILSNAQFAEHVPNITAQWKGLLAVSILNGVQIAANNASLAVLELSMNQVVRSIVPVLTALLGICIQGKVPTALEMSSLVCVSAGVIVCVYKEGQTNSWLGLLLVGTSAVVQAAQMSLSGHLMSKRLSSFQMTFYTGPAAYLLLLPLGVWHEGRTLGEALRTRAMEVVAFLLGSCMLAVLYNIVFFQCLQTISPVGTSVMANAKIVLLILVSALLLGELSTWPFLQGFGCALTIGGTFAYSALRQGCGQQGVLGRPALTLRPPGDRPSRFTAYSTGLVARTPLTQSWRRMVP